MFWFSKPTPAQLTVIYVSPAKGEDMLSVQQATAFTQRGIEGDRYWADKGQWIKTDGCQLTLITSYEVARVQRRFKGNWSPGLHRRNLEISGIKPKQLLKRHLRIGEALCLVNKPRPPCLYIDRLVGNGMAKALGKDAGFCLEIVEGGVMRVGDPVEIV